MTVQPAKEVAYLYGLGLAESDEIRYVGQTCGSVASRFYKHQYDARRGVKRPLYTWMRKHYDDVVVSTFLTCHFSVVDEYEILAIAGARDAGHRLLNLAEGGRSNRGWRMPDAQKAALSQSRKEWITPEHIAKMIEGRRNMEWTDRQRESSSQTIRAVALARRGVPHSDSHREAISQARRGQTMSLNAILKMSTTKRRRALTEQEITMITDRFNQRQRERSGG